jgi:hypothetical protein
LQQQGLQGRLIQRKQILPCARTGVSAVTGVGDGAVGEPIELVWFYTRGAERLGQTD